MKLSKRVVCLALTGALTMGGTLTSYAGQWIFDGPADWQWWYQNDNGSYTTNNWQEIDGKRYHFDNNGYLDVGIWLKEEVLRSYTLPGGGNTNSYYEDVWYLTDNQGIMVTNKSWEGGYLKENGELEIENITRSDNNSLQYWNENTQSWYDGTIGWKAELAKSWGNAIGGRDAIGTYKVDFQLPENWHEQCPKPLMSVLVDAVCAEVWAGGYWVHSWSIDENYVIHISADFAGYEIYH